MLVTSRLLGLTNGKSYLTNMGVKQQYRNDSILTLINTPPPPLEIVNKRPYFTKRPILIALLGYMYIEINRGLPSFNSSFIACLNRDMCAHNPYERTVLSNEWFRRLFALARKYRETTSPFSNFLDRFQIYNKLCFAYSSVSRRRNKHSVPNNRPPFTYQK